MIKRVTRTCTPVWRKCTLNIYHWTCHMWHLYIMSSPNQNTPTATSPIRTQSLEYVIKYITTTRNIHHNNIHPFNTSLYSVTPHNTLTTSPQQITTMQDSTPWKWACRPLTDLHERSKKFNKCVCDLPFPNKVGKKTAAQWTFVIIVIIVVEVHGLIILFVVCVLFKIGLCWLSNILCAERLRHKQTHTLT